MERSRFLLASLIVAAAATTAYAQMPGTPGYEYPFNYSNTHGDHMVLQSDTPATLWGFGTLFQPITITITSNSSLPSSSIMNISVLGYVSSTGIWRISLPSQPPGGPYTILGYSSYTNESFTLQDVYFGHVVICGGQSNMAYGMSSIANATAELAASAARPLIRIFSSQYSAQNYSQLQVVPGTVWTIAAPTSPLQYFSALCYLSAAVAYDALNGTIPMGLIDTSVGGTAAQLWISPTHFNDCVATMQPYDVYNWPWSASCWYNGMLSPFTQGPTQIKYVLWDQGENNVGERPFYECLFPRIIETWRLAFGDYSNSIPFYYVQLPAYMRQQGDSSLADFREGQLYAAETVPKTGFISTVDLGDAYDGSIHNRDKSKVGARMGALIWNEVYGGGGSGGSGSTPYKYPEYQSATASTQGTTVTVTITVGPADTLYGGLQYIPPSFDSNATWCPTARGVNTTYCDWLYVQTSDGLWLNATSVSIGAGGDTIILTVEGAAAGVSAIATRNGFADWPVTNVYNGAKLPVIPWTPRNISSS